MPSTPIAAADGRYDGPTILLHWLTALLVVTLFALAEIWGFLPRGGLRHSLQSLHISLGLTLTVVVVLRLLWRGAFSRRLPPADSGILELGARAVHVILYLLLITMVISGFGRQWSEGRPLGFFSLAAVPDPFGIAKAWHPLLSEIHTVAAWSIIVLAGLHAVAALFHHYALRDGVLQRMMPDHHAP